MITVDEMIVLHVNHGGWRGTEERKKTEGELEMTMKEQGYWYKQLEIIGKVFNIANSRWLLDNRCV